MFGISADDIFVSSILCGYPIGAKLIGDSALSKDDATRACAFCSSASPIFAVATVGTKLLKNVAATAVLLGCHLLSTVICGLFFRKKKVEKTSIIDYGCDIRFDDIGETVTSSVLSVLSVGGLIALFFMLTDMAKSFLPSNLAQSPAVGFAVGLLEMTNGIISVCAVCDTFAATVLSSFLLAFGGLCVFCQSMTFLSRKGVSPWRFLYQKIAQGSVASLLAFVVGKAVGI